MEPEVVASWEDILNPAAVMATFMNSVAGCAAKKLEACIASHSLFHSPTSVIVEFRGPYTRFVDGNEVPWVPVTHNFAGTIHFVSKDPVDRLGNISEEHWVARYGEMEEFMAWFMPFFRDTVCAELGAQLVADGMAPRLHEFEKVVWFTPEERAAKFPEAVRVVASVWGAGEYPGSEPAGPRFREYVPGSGGLPPLA